MHFITLDQLKVRHASGEHLAITLRAEEHAFAVSVANSAGISLTLADGASQPQHFGDLCEALLLLHRIGIFDVRVDSERWKPSVEETAEYRRIQSALNGLKDGSNQVYSSEEWEQIRSAWKVQRDAP